MIRRDAQRLLIALAILAQSAVVAAAPDDSLEPADPDARQGSKRPCLLDVGGAACRSRAGGHGWFPPEAFQQHTRLRYSEFLATLDESPIYSMRQPRVEVYRFLWFQLEIGPSVTLRIQNDNGRKTLVIKQKGVVRVHRKTLSAKQWDGFVRLLEDANFWRLGTEGSVRGLDGAHWVLEGSKNGRYHVVDRWSPDALRSPTEEDRRFRNACEYLLELAGFGPWLGHP